MHVDTRDQEVQIESTPVRGRYDEDVLEPGRCGRAVLLADLSDIGEIVLIDPPRCLGDQLRRIVAVAHDAEDRVTDPAQVSRAGERVLALVEEMIEGEQRRLQDRDLDRRREPADAAVEHRFVGRRHHVDSYPVGWPALLRCESFDMLAILAEDDRRTARRRVTLDDAVALEDGHDAGRQGDPMPVLVRDGNAAGLVLGAQQRRERHDQRRVRFHQLRVERAAGPVVEARRRRSARAEATAEPAWDRVLLDGVRAGGLAGEEAGRHGRHTVIDRRNVVKPAATL